jgi:hypothetical protein
MAKGISSKGIKLSYGTDGNYTELTNLQEIPELGSEGESIEVTTLADSARVYIEGIQNYGDNLSFKFLYLKSEFETLNGLTESIGWKIEFPDGLTCTFTGKASVKMDGAGISQALTYTLNIKPDSAMIFA